MYDRWNAKTKEKTNNQLEPPTNKIECLDVPFVNRSFYVLKEMKSFNKEEKMER